VDFNHVLRSHHSATDGDWYAGLISKLRVLISGTSYVGRDYWPEWSGKARHEVLLIYHAESVILTGLGLNARGIGHC